MQRSRGFDHGVVVSRTCWGIFRSPMVPCDHCKTMNSFGDWVFNHGGWEVGLPAFQLPMFAECDYCRCQQEIRFTCLSRIRNQSVHSLPVAWCSRELVFYRISPPLHHGDSFAAKELLSPLLSPVIIFAHRIQSTAGKIWSLIERFDRCAAVPCDSALIRWRSIAVVPSKIQDFAEFDGPTAGFHLFVKVPDSWPRIKDHLQAEGNECRKVTSDEEQLCPRQSKHFCQRQGVGQWNSRRQRWDILQCDSSEIVIVIVSFLVAPAL